MWSPIPAVHVNSTFAFSPDTEIVTSENALSLYPVLPCCPLTCVFSVYLCFLCVKVGILSYSKECHQLTSELSKCDTRAPFTPPQQQISHTEIQSHYHPSLSVSVSDLSCWLSISPGPGYGGSWVGFYTTVEHYLSRCVSLTQDHHIVRSPQVTVAGYSDCRVL